MNEWFRDQNLTDPLNIPVDDATMQGVNTGTYVSDVAKGGLPFKASKYHDYFTSCLPAPQKGPDVTIQTAQLGNAPVVPMNKPVPKDLLNYPYNVYIPNGNSDFEAGYHAGSVHRNAFGGAYWLRILVMRIWIRPLIMVLPVTLLTFGLSLIILSPLLPSMS